MFDSDVHPLKGIVEDKLLCPPAPTFTGPNWTMLSASKVPEEVKLKEVSLYDAGIIS